MNYTEKYHLPQWKKEDRIMMEDFNRMCADIEAGLTANAQATEKVHEEAVALPYTVGSYTGSGLQDQDIEVGFRPSFVFICGNQVGYNPSSDLIKISGFCEAQNSEGRVTFTDTGFRVAGVVKELPYPRINHTGKVYGYIAFR